MLRTIGVDRLVLLSPLFETCMTNTKKSQSKDKRTGSGLEWKKVQSNNPPPAQRLILLGRFVTPKKTLRLPA